MRSRGKTFPSTILDLTPLPSSKTFIAKERHGQKRTKALWIKPEKSSWIFKRERPKTWSFGKKSRTSAWIPSTPSTICWAFNSISLTAKVFTVTGSTKFTNACSSTASAKRTTGTRGFSSRTQEIRQTTFHRPKEGWSEQLRHDGLGDLVFPAGGMEGGANHFVTDGRQHDHFEQLFMTTRKWFSAENRAGKNFLTFGLGQSWVRTTRRSNPGWSTDQIGGSSERGNRAGGQDGERKKTELTEDEVTRRAKIIGLGAVKYADLSQDRTLDYVFSWTSCWPCRATPGPICNMRWPA